MLLLNHLKGGKHSSPTKAFNTSLNEPNLNSTKSPTKINSIEKQLKQTTTRQIQNNSSISSPSIKSKPNELTSDYESSYKNSSQTKRNSLQSNETHEIEQSRKASTGSFQKKTKSKINNFDFLNYVKFLIVKLKRFKTSER
jgi:hypothetical protein